MKKQIAEDKERKNEERKLAEQETKFGSKTEEELHAYAWKSTHVRATQDFSTPRQPWPRLGAWKPTHMRGKPIAHVPESRLDKPKRDQDFLKP
ncbi:hypothetical protein PIB30_108963 [Stylosanthes scabra]|uniref:Uncharacterized protein n=1 Tax=Stylosanthes scabra TaxID=79078 RepID=A0ABU6SZU9_9FABA|nr:hypothetical protein [Stylosanthes scabra]